MSETKRERFIRSVCSEGEYRPYMNAPGRVGRWTIATDGHALVAYPREDADPTPLDGWPETAEGYVLAQLDGALGEFAQTTVGELREWAGDPSEECSACTPETRQTAGKCAGCRGRGKWNCVCDECGDDHPARCEECDGTGRGPCAVCDGYGRLSTGELDRVGTLAGHMVNLRLLAWALREAPDGEVVVGSTVCAHPAVQVVGEPWRLVIMPLRPEGEYAASARRNVFAPAAEASA